MATGKTNAGGGGGTGGTLVVTAPVGVTVIATNDELGKTASRVTNYEGKATFRGLATGTWLIYITDGERTSKTVSVVINADYATVLEFFTAYITVTYPAGSVCTCTDGVTTLTAPDVTGTWRVTVPNEGTWTLSVTDGDQAAGAEVVITTEDQEESVILAYFSATIDVTYPEGSVCTCTDGTNTFTAPDTSGSVTFTVPNIGTWTVSCTNGTDIDSGDVSITTSGESKSITLSYVLVLYENGTFASGYDAAKRSQTGNASITKYDTCMEWVESGNSWDFFYITPAICPAKYSTLNISFNSDTKVNIDSNSGKWGLNVNAPGDSFNSPSFAGYTKFSDFTGATTLTYNVSTYTGTTLYYPTMHFGTTDTTALMYVTKIWLEP